MDWDPKGVELIRQGRFEEALDYIKGLPSIEMQGVTITSGLFGYSLQKIGIQAIAMTKSRQEYDRVRALMGQNNGIKVVLFENQETNAVEGIEELIDEAVPKDSPLLEYARDLRKQRDSK